MTADPLLLVPGLLCTERLFQPQTDIIKDRPVFIADHRSQDTIDGLVLHILRQAPPRFTLAGLSMGGFLAMEIALKAPERVLRLALLSTTARADTEEQRIRRQQQIQAARAGKLTECVSKLLPLFLGPKSIDKESLVACVYQMAEDTGAEAFCRQQRALLAHRDLRPVLNRIDCPTLVLVGRDDCLTPPDRASEIAAAIPDSELVVAENCGHLSTLEAPETVNRALLDWL